MNKHEPAPIGDLDSLDAVAAYLAASFEKGDPGEVAAALVAVANAPGLAELAAAAGVPREELKQALNAGELSLDLTLAIMKVIDLHLPPSAGS